MASDIRIFYQLGQISRYFFTLNTYNHVTILMNKLGILGIVIAGAFVVGVLSANSQAVAEKVDPVAEAIDRLTAVITNTATQGPPGPQGEEGPQGEQGETGPSGTELYTKTQSFVVVGEGRQLVTQNCNPGDTVINGYLVHSSVIIDTNQFASQANDSNCWVVEFATTLNPADPFDFVIVCAEGSLPEN